MCILFGAFCKTKQLLRTQTDSAGFHWQFVLVSPCRFSECFIHFYFKILMVAQQWHVTFLIPHSRGKRTEVQEESKEPLSNQLRLQHPTNPTHVHQFNMKHDSNTVTMCDNGGPCQNMYQNFVHISKTTNAQTGGPTFNGCYGSSSGASFRLHQHLNPNNSICEETCFSHFT